MAVREKYRLPERYIISVGTVQPRKNQLLTVRALGKLPERVKLVIVGSMKGAYADKVRREIERLGLSDRVIHLSNVPFADLPALYACAEVSLYTSRYEGFGLPIVESLTVGTPVVACTGSCLEEAGGEGAVYVHPDDAVAYAEAPRDLSTTPWRTTPWPAVAGAISAVSAPRISPAPPWQAIARP